MVTAPGKGSQSQSQTAAKLILEPIFEADLEPDLYGYRPKRSAGDAIQEADKLLHKGYTGVVDARV